MWKYSYEYIELSVVLQPEPNLVVDVVRNPQPIGAAPSLPVLSMDMMPLPEMEKFTVELKKDYHGLGITIAGYVCEKGEVTFSHLNYGVRTCAHSITVLAYFTTVLHFVLCEWFH